MTRTPATHLNTAVRSGIRQDKEPVPAPPEFLEYIRGRLRFVEDAGQVATLYLLPSSGRAMSGDVADSVLTQVPYGDTSPERPGQVSYGLRRTLLTECPLPDLVAEELAARAGADGTIALARNPYLSELLWAKAYAALTGPARVALVRRRLLTAAQRAFIVSCAETDPWVLDAVAGQLGAAHLRELATVATGHGAAILKDALERRACGEGPTRRADGAGAVPVHVRLASQGANDAGGPDDAGLISPASVVDAPVERFAEDPESRDLMPRDPRASWALAAVLLQHLGHGSTSSSLEAWSGCIELSNGWPGTIGELLAAVEALERTP